MIRSDSAAGGLRLWNGGTWGAATTAYANINAPALVIWGEQDWARPHDREQQRRLLPRARFATVAGGGHFLPLDRPDALIEQISLFLLQTRESMRAP